MFRRAFAAVTVALASFALAQAAQAGVVNFEDRFTAADLANPLYPDIDKTEADSFTEQGLKFSGLQFYFIPKNNPDVTFPTSYGSTFMETAVEPVVMSLAGGGAFDLTSLDLGLGNYNQSSSDTVEVTGTKANCITDCTISTVLNVTNVFQTFSLTGFSDLASISFGAQQFSNLNAPFPPQADSGYLAFDNIAFSATVPEPASWGLMILGFGAIGGLLRGRRLAAAPTAAI